MARPTPDATLVSGELVQKDITYCTPDKTAVKLDLYRSRAASTRPAPAVVYVHGGAWMGGDKSGGEGSIQIPELAMRGFVVVAVNYRLAPNWKFPAQIEDVKCAVRFLRANAAKYDIDPRRIGAWGASAGGQLVALLGLTDASAGFDIGEYRNESSRVEAVVDLYGPADLTKQDYAATHASVYRDVFGVTSRLDPALVRASPVTYITKNGPPFLILHGDRDGTVPFDQSQELQTRLKTAGVSAELVVVKNAGHGFVPVGGAISPTTAEMTKLIGDFFVSKLAAK